MKKQLGLNEIKSIIYDVVILNNSLEDILINRYNVELYSEDYNDLHDQLHDYITNVM